MIPMRETAGRAARSASRQHASILAATLLLALAVPAAAAPVAGPNVNVMSGNKFPDGDPFLTKQNEPSIAVSSRNPQHLLAASNDYRAAELSTIEGVGGGKAWISLYKSVNGGGTWRPMLLAGCPLGNAQCNSGNAAIKGLEFSADPTLRAGPYGTFFLSFIAGRRDTSAGGVTAVQRFFDRNDAVRNGQDPFVADVLSILDTGTEGQFKDKPWVVADVPGRSWLAGKTCDLRPNYGSAPVPAFNVYVSFSNFVGQSDPNPHPQLFVSASDDCGKTFGKPGEGQQFRRREFRLVARGRSLHRPCLRRLAPFRRRRGRHSRRHLPQQVDRRRQAVQQSEACHEHQGVRPGDHRQFVPQQRLSLPRGVGRSRRREPRPCGLGRTQGSARSGHPGCLAPDGNCDARITIITSSDGGTTFAAPVRVDDWVSDPINPANPGRGHQIQPALAFAAGKLAITWIDQRYTQTVGELRCQSTDGVAGCSYPDEYREVRVPAGNLAACSSPAGAACAAARSHCVQCLHRRRGPDPPPHG